MAVSSSAWVLSAKGVAVSAAVLSAALALKLSAPSVSDLAWVQIPLLWLSLLSWLEPPYIYLVINGIIVTIAASSKLQGNRHEAEEEARVISAAELSGGGHVFVLPPDGIVCPSPRKNVVSEESGAAGVSEAECAERLVAEGGGGDGHGDRVVEEEEEFVISRSTWTPAARRTNSPEVSAERLPAPEKPVVSSRFVHRRPSKASPEALGVIKPKRQETLENTWKPITGDRVVEEEEEFVISRSTWTPAARRTNSPEVSAERLPAPEKPVVSSRFVHRRPSKASPEALGVIKPKRQETLENTWKPITDGRAMPLTTRRLRKSETWENRGHPIDPLDQPRPAMRKSETFKDRTNQLPTSPPSPSPRKEASPSQDELNRRVEAFIRKFNEEMRLQRQESLNQCKAMMNRGS